MNKEVYYDGWLIKSPPTKRIWRARWRRRWFTLKQGEIPEQFCLEYYTDRNCRKLKGVIDLDQCEQVDCGLRLENRKQKFQYMFDIKTPKRTYYLAADTEEDMRDWVNCICQVCHLHDTKQSTELQDEQKRAFSSTALTNSTDNTTTTSLNSSTGIVVTGGGTLDNSRQLINNILRRPNTDVVLSGVVDQQPRTVTASTILTETFHNNSESAYVNTEYTNRETLICEMSFDKKELSAAIAATPQTDANTPKPSSSPAAGVVYLNSPVLQALVEQESARLVINTNGVVRKIPENLVLNNIPLPESQQNSVQPSPALSTASGPYIPISECFSGSPKFLVDSNNPSTPLNNLDPKFYDTPRSHNNIGLNLTNDQSYSPKITNCSLQQMSLAKNRSHRSDSDSESVFTDDDEWTHPLPLRENLDRSTRPSDSSIENESFVLTYSQRFSKVSDEGGKEQLSSPTSTHTLDKLAKVLKNKNNLILDIKETEKVPRDIPQLSDTENTSPAIGPRDATSVVEESYDIPRSHNLPYHNMAQFFEKMTSPEANPIAASTPNLMACLESGLNTPASVRTLPRHYYTNAAPAKVEGTVFRYDFIEQCDLPPVNRKLKPKVNSEDKPPEEVPAKPPTIISVSAVPVAHSQQNSPTTVDILSNKLNTVNVHSCNANENSPLYPPSVDRKLKPNVFKASNSGSMFTSARRSTGVPLSMVLPNTNESYVMETRTLPRQPRTNFAVGTTQSVAQMSNISPGCVVQHQRTASAAAAMHVLPEIQTPLQLPPKNEHKLQYFDLDVANLPAINRQSISVGNLYAQGPSKLTLPADPSARVPIKSSVVYNSVDFIKTEAFQRIREERKKKSEGVNNNK
ncbi:protein daughter of sevenless [Teleopsis dalmanni]|uniref:protein daughter of sevenless n=1 Tax=Teleopsis dalmanni TaxID=139649 RepID=UPI0018CF8D7F|nr:protein daughter of sevenless [Teleopsis dalmanni]